MVHSGWRISSCQWTTSRTSSKSSLLVFAKIGQHADRVPIDTIKVRHFWTYWSNYASVITSQSAISHVVISYPSPWFSRARKMTWLHKNYNDEPNFTGPNSTELWIDLSQFWCSNCAKKPLFKQTLPIHQNSSLKVMQSQIINKNAAE